MGLLACQDFLAEHVFLPPHPYLACKIGKSNSHGCVSPPCNTHKILCLKYFVVEASLLAWKQIKENRDRLCNNDFA